MPQEKRTPAQVRETARRRLEKLDADTWWDLHVKKSKHNRSERLTELERSRRRKRKRKRDREIPTMRQLFQEGDRRPKERMPNRISPGKRQTTRRI